MSSLRVLRLTDDFSSATGEAIASIITSQSPAPWRSPENPASMCHPVPSAAFWSNRAWRS